MILLESETFIRRVTRVDAWTQIRENAWIGDAVLALYVRSWLLDSAPDLKSAHPVLFELFTSNQFLSTFGEPTRVEAEIGQIYRQEGLAGAFSAIESKLLERFIRTARNRGIFLGTASIRKPAPGASR